MLTVKLDKRFKKDIQRDKKSGNFKDDDFDELKQVMTNLIDEIELDEKYLDHKLIGNFKGNNSRCFSNQFHSKQS